MRFSIQESRQAARRLAKLLVLAFWIGGGAMAGGLAPLYLRGLQPPADGQKIIQDLLFWFSNAEIVTGGLLLLLLFFFEPRRRAMLFSLGGLTALVLINEYLIGSWQRNASSEATVQTLSLIYILTFVGVELGAIILFSIIALSTWPAPPEPPAPHPPAHLPPRADHSGQ